MKGPKVFVLVVRGTHLGQTFEHWHSVLTCRELPHALAIRNELLEQQEFFHLYPSLEHNVLIRERPPCTPFGVERAEAIYAERGPFGALADVTPGEDAYVAALWATMPGTTCWMDAFHRIRRGEVLP